MAVILETERLLFRDHEPEDLEPFCVMEADPDVRRFVGGAPRSRERAEAKFRQVYLQPVPDRMALRATVYKPEGVYIGYCGIYPHFDDKGSGIPGEGVLAFYLARPYWGRGLATEAGQAFLRFGFEQLGLSRIVATVQIGNDASVRVLEKLSLSRVGTQIGGMRSFYFYEITQQVWAASLVR
jgi:RimJ/RimL family protein N-acetyltransferase